MVRESVRSGLPDTISRLLRDGHSLTINFLQNGVTTTAQQSFADGLSQCDGIMAIARFAQQLRSVGVGNDGFQMQHALPHFRDSADGYLTASAEFVQQCALAGS